MNKNWILNKCFQNNIIKNRKKKSVSYVSNEPGPLSISAFLTPSLSLTILNHILKKRNTSIACGYKRSTIRTKKSAEKRNLLKRNTIFFSKKKKNVLRKKNFVV